MTVIIGAKCSDGIILIADKRLTRKNGKVIYNEKIFGDLAHFLIGYSGDTEMFDIFRRYTTGDVMMKRDDPERYTLNNLLTKTSRSIKRFNEIAGRPFKALLASHEEHKLYHIDVDGSWTEETYRAIGSGEKTADMFCKGLSNELTIKNFSKRAYLAIMYMDQYCPGLGVGVEPDDNPDIRYLRYNEEWDRKAPAEDILEFKKLTNEKMEQFRQSFDKIIME